MFNLSIESGLCCMALFPLLFYISRSARSIGNTINSSVQTEHPKKLSILHDLGSSSSLNSMSNTVVISTLVRGHHYHYLMDFFPHRSKRGVDKKASYPNIGNKGWLFSKEKRVPVVNNPDFNPQDKK